MAEISVEYLPNGLLLRQSEGVFKLGQDSIALAHFAKLRRGARLLDLGCGTGVLALSAWRQDLSIVGLELQEQPLSLFRQSIAQNGLTNVSAVQGDLREIGKYFAQASFDYVLCNPPYFRQDAGRVSEQATIRRARSEQDCTIDEVCAALSYLLGTGGKAALVFRPERLCVLLSALARHRLFAKRLRAVQQTAAHPPSAVLLECRKDGSAEGLSLAPALLIDSDEGRAMYGR